MAMPQRMQKKIHWSLPWMVLLSTAQIIASVPSHAQGFGMGNGTMFGRPGMGFYGNRGGRPGPIFGPTAPVVYAPSLGGEEICHNGIDDNGNGLVDEGPCVDHGTSAGANLGSVSGGGPTMPQLNLEDHTVVLNAWFYKNAPALDLTSLRQLNLLNLGQGRTLESIQLRGWSGDGTSRAYIFLNDQQVGVVTLSGGDRLQDAFVNTTSLRLMHSDVGSGNVMEMGEIRSI